MTKLDRGVSLAAIAIIAVALAAGPAHARGGLKAQTVELLLAEGVPCDPTGESTEIESCDANANASAVTAYESKRNPAPTSTIWTAIAENLLDGPTYHLFNRDPDVVMDVDACNDGNFIANLTLYLYEGNIANPTMIGEPSPGEPSDTVDICREESVDNWIWVLPGSFTGGASGGGKDNNRRNK